MSSTTSRRVAVLGAGKMGEALLSGMLRSGTAPSGPPPCASVTAWTW
jgi:pyrroline-5-carboxylate reductase